MIITKKMLYQKSNDFLGQQSIKTKNCFPKRDGKQLMDKKSRKTIRLYLSGFYSSKAKARYIF